MGSDADSLARQLNTLSESTRYALVQSTPILVDQLCIEPARLRTEDDAPIFNPSVAVDEAGS